MAIKFGIKLIWQSNSPAPYESSWSIFTKLLLLNVMKPQQLAMHISNFDKSPGLLKTNNSNWIDFNKFADCLETSPENLKQGFLDQFGFKNTIDTCRGIKLCTECIKIGYHCIFFQLPFITHCPWHNVKLTPPCMGCVSVLSSNGLIRSINNDYLEQVSRCGHVNMLGGKVKLSNMLTVSQKNVINEYCELFLMWWHKVYKSFDMRHFLSEQHLSEDQFKKLPMYLSAAELLAGPCPWYIETIRNSVKTISWKQSENFFQRNHHEFENWEFETETVKRKSDLDLAYRSVRRHLFRKFIKPHKRCWNELSNYKYDDAMNLLSDNVCVVSLAFATWRLSIEDLINIEAFKSSKLKDREILSYRIDSDDFTNTLHGHVSLLYAYFFYLWESMHVYSGVEKFKVVKSFQKATKSDFAATYNFEKWLVVFPNYFHLEEKSFVRYAGQLQENGWMINDTYYEYFQFLNSSNSLESGCMFKLFKKKHSYEMKSLKLTIEGFSRPQGNKSPCYTASWDANIQA